MNRFLIAIVLVLGMVGSALGAGNLPDTMELKGTYNDTIKNILDSKQTALDYIPATGVVCDGSTDNTTTLGNAIVAAYNKTLILPNGTGTCKTAGNYTPTSPVRIVGNGSAIELTANNPLINITNIDGVNLDHVIINVPSTNTAPVLKYTANSMQVRISDLNDVTMQNTAGAFGSWIAVQGNVNNTHGINYLNWDKLKILGASKCFDFESGDSTSWVDNNHVTNLRCDGYTDAIYVGANLLGFNSNYFTIASMEAYRTTPATVINIAGGAMDNYFFLDTWNDGTSTLTPYNLSANTEGNVIEGFMETNPNYGVDLGRNIIKTSEWVGTYGGLHWRNSLHYNTLPFNRIFNGDFESGTTLWTGSNATLTADVTTYKYGAKSLKVAATSTGGYAYQDLGKYIDYKGKPVSASAWVNCTSGNTSGAYLGIVDGVGTTYSYILPHDGTWNYISITRNISASATKVEVQLSVPTNGDSCYFDNVTLNDGSIAYPYNAISPVAGLDTYVQYNNAGSPGGSSNFKWTDSSTTLSIIGSSTPTLSLATTAASQSASVTYWDNGTLKWQHGVLGDGYWTLWDAVNSKVMMSAVGNSALNLVPTGDGYVGIGLYSPPALLSVSSDYQSGAAGTPTILLRGNSNKERIEIDALGAGNAAQLQGYSGGGTVASPTQTTGAMSLLRLGASGWDNTNAKISGMKALMGVYAGSDFTTTSTETYWAFSTTPAASTTMVERFRIAGSGDIYMYNLTNATGTESLCYDVATGLVKRQTSNSCLSSSRSTKHDIKPYLKGLDYITHMNPVSYRYNNNPKTERLGLIADDLPDTRMIEYSDQKEVQNYDDRAIIATLVNAVKELNSKIERLESQCGR